MSIKEQFYIARKTAMKDVQQEANRIVGRCTGHSKITKAAWAIVAGRPQYAKFLYGVEAGSKESYQILDTVKEDAVRVLNILNFLRMDYYKNGNFKSTWEDPHYTMMMHLIDDETNKVDDIQEVLSKQASDKGEKRLQNRKKYLKYTVCSLLGFSFCFFSSSLVGTLLLIGLFSAYVLLTG